MSEPDPQSGLSPPTVPATAYDEQYYLHACAGADEWRASHAREIAGLYPGSLEVARLRPGDVLVDIGTGRGELLAAAIDRGAARAIGIEYSEDAIRLARRTIDVHGVADRAEVLHADARAIPLEDECADLVTLLDVVEHLAPHELSRTLAEAYRLLKPGGRLVIHTVPSRTIYEVTYRLQRALRPGRRRAWPADPRNDYERRMHVNEQTLRALRRSLRRAGFRPARVRVGSWIYTDFVPEEKAKALYRRLAAFPPTARLGTADLWAEGTKPTRRRRGGELAVR
jgi:ubiquinone/menaquinone biosynthesis C-methylase UbiE